MNHISELPHGYAISHCGITLNSQEERPHQDEIAICQQWLTQFARPQRTINRRAQSYALKEYVEQWSQRYIANGALIEAARSLGYTFHVIESGPNVIFAMAFQLPCDAWQAVHPSGFTRWLFTQRTRNDTIGDLARDALVDPLFPRRATDVADVLRCLRDQCASDAAIKSLIVAWTEYSDRPHS